VFQWINFGTSSMSFYHYSVDKDAERTTMAYHVKIFSERIPLQAWDEDTMDIWILSGDD